MAVLLLILLLDFSAGPVRVRTAIYMKRIYRKVARPVGRANKASYLDPICRLMP